MDVDVKSAIKREYEQVDGDADKIRTVIPGKIAIPTRGNLAQQNGTHRKMQEEPLNDIMCSSLKKIQYPANGGESTQVIGNSEGNKSRENKKGKALALKDKKKQS